jgi:hypothetical protein
MYLNLWPIPPGRVGLAAGQGGRDVRARQPRRVLGTPGLVGFDEANPRTSADGSLAVCVASWLAHVAPRDLPPLRLAPPVFEVWSVGGRLRERRVVNFGLEGWQLPPAYGI